MKYHEKVVKYQQENAILREALIEILYADHAMYCDEDDVYHICDKCDAMQITAYKALQKAGGEG